MPKPADIIAHLTKTIAWFRQTDVEKQLATDTNDVTFLDEDQKSASQIVRLAFEFARQQETLASKQRKSEQQSVEGDGTSRNQGLVRAMAKADQQLQQSQQELDALRQKLAETPERKRAAVQSAMAETQSEIALVQARRDVLRTMLDFVNGTNTNGLGATGFRAQIEELARSVPSALSASPLGQPEPAGTSTPQASPAYNNRQQPNGIWALAGDLLRLSRKKRALDEQARATNALLENTRQFRGPLLANLRGLIQAGDQLSNQPQSDDPAVLAEQKKQLDQLTVQFKQAAASMLPLSKQVILLDFYSRNLMGWRDMVKREYRDELRGFLWRLAVLAVIIGFVFGTGELWRRSIFRYIHDPRRRYQLLLLRRIVMWCVVVSVVAFTFATELGSVATFAGLLTAGVAVALQNVILSIAGYFFLIGKYGIRVGDRVSVAGVTGEVVEIGLVRLHLLELGGAGDSQPSGRVVAFSNSIVFQPTAGLFKQIPGTTFVWHEVSLTFAPDSDYRLVRERTMAATDAALKDYSSGMERQMRRMEQTLNSISAIELRPKVRLHFTMSGIEVLIRFPVELQQAAEIDDRVMRELYAAIDLEPKLKLAGSGMPTLRTDVAMPARV